MTILHALSLLGAQRRNSVCINTEELHMNYEIDITRRCNFKCPGCNHLCNIISDRSSDMTPDDIRSIVDQINANDKNPRRIIVIGGEPTLHPKCLEYCRYIKDNLRSYSELRMNTNFSRQDIASEVEKMGYGLADYLGPRDPESQRKAKFDTHYNALISPSEAGIPIQDPRSCFILKGVLSNGPCGMCVHKYKGRVVWCYCPNATSIAKLLQREDEFMFPTLAELLRSDMDKLCSEVCVHCMSIAYRPILAKDTIGQVSKCFSKGLAEFKKYGAAQGPEPEQGPATEPAPAHAPAPELAAPRSGDAEPSVRPLEPASAAGAGSDRALLRSVISSKFDRIMYLTCPQGVGRASAMRASLAELGVSGMAFPYLNVHNAFAHAELARRRFANEGASRTNVVNCMTGHYGMVRFALDAGFENVLFMEDDCRFVVPPMELARYISDMPKGVNATIDYLGVKPEVHAALFNRNPILLWAALPSGLFFDNLTCYALNREGMRCVVDYFERCGTEGYRWPVDAADRLWPYLTSSVPVYIPRARFARQNGGKSLIGGVEV